MSENAEQGSIWSEEAAAAAARGERVEPEPSNDEAGEAARAQEPADAPGRSRSSSQPRPIVPREYYSISEVCDLVGLKPHVLRYWESQFPVLNPSKNRSGNRVYQRKEIKLILLVAHLLYKEKYTIEGARQKIDQLRRGGELPETTAHALDHEMLDLLRADLQQALDVLSPPAEH